MDSSFNTVAYLLVSQYIDIVGMIKNELIIFKLLYDKV